MAARQRKRNFGAGPAELPIPVLEEFQKAIPNYKGTGVGVLEISHRSPEYVEILKEAQANLKSLLRVPDTHEVLFMHGGGWGQFSAVPMNLTKAGEKADYVVTGSWSRASCTEAAKFATYVEFGPYVNKVANGEEEDGTFSKIPPVSEWKFDEESKYLYYCDNETVHGIEFPNTPDVSIPLVADMSSNFLSRPIDFTKFGAQKNCGIPGVTIVIARKDILIEKKESVPSILDYSLVFAKNSAHNTPSTVSTFVTGLVLKWVMREGGVEEMERRSRAKSSLIYGEIDAHPSFYRTIVSPECRSRINIVFRLQSEELEKKFIAEAASAGFVGLAGGIRASLYNVQTIESAQELLAYMVKFRKANSQ